MGKIKVTDFYTLWLRAAHLPADGTMATIVNVAVETLHPTPTEQKKVLVLTFRNASRKLALNQTQANTLVELFGEDVDSWIGQPVELTPKALNKRITTILISAAPEPARQTQATGAPELDAYFNQDAVK